MQCTGIDHDKSTTIGPGLWSLMSAIFHAVISKNSEESKTEKTLGRKPPVGKIAKEFSIIDRAMTGSQQAIPMFKQFSKVLF